MKTFCASLAVIGLVSSAEAASISALGFLPARPGASKATGISSDGKVVVGVGLVAPGIGSDKHAFRWSAESGLEDIHQGLPRPGSQMNESEAFAVSADGSVVVGMCNFQAFRWKRDEGMIGLGDLEGGSLISSAQAVTPDGTIIFGYGFDAAGAQGVKWTAPNVMTVIDGIERVYGCSADGRIVIGSGDIFSGTRWEEGVGFLNLGDFSPCTNGYRGGLGNAISRDGKVLLGSAYPKDGSCDIYDEGFDPYRWTSERGLEQLEPPRGSFFSSVECVSATGTLMGGSTYFLSEGSKAMLWNEAGRAWAVWNVLASQGADLSHWKGIVSVNGISDNGLVLAGVGLNRDGKEEAFRAQLDHINLFGFDSPGVVGNVATLSWPKNLAVILEKKGFDGGDWEPVQEGISDVGDNRVFSKELTGAPAAFRLKATP